MAHIYERVVQLISKDPSRRDARDIESLIPWFQNMSGLFKSQKTDVVKDIVRNCEFRSVPADNVIIKQGDIGACFYIILSGAVSIYINQTLEEQGNVQSPTDLAKAARKAKKARTRGRSHSLKLSAAKLGGLPSNAHASSQQRPPQQRGPGEAEGPGPGGARPGRDGSRAGPAGQQPGGSAARKSRAHTWVSTTTKYSAQEASFYQKSERGGRGGEGGGGDGEPSSSSSDDGEEMQTTSTGKLDRTVFGVHIRELGPGKSFGELALVQTDLVRSASVIADQPTGLIVVERDLYNRCLKAAQQQEFADKKNFVNSFPLFSHWTPRQKSVMAMSLTRVQYQFGNSLVRQGEKVRGLIFITSGRAVVSIDPVHHIEQCPSMCSPRDVAFAKEVRTGRRSRSCFPGSSDYWPSELRRAGPNTARRRDGYAAAEKEVYMRTFQLCVVGPNDYIGDISVLLHLPTYVSTATCLEPLETLELDLSNFERQVFKKSHSTYVAMREIAELRLSARISRLRDEQVYSPVFETMLAKFRDMNTTPAMKAALRRKQAEDEDLMVSLFTPSWHSYREKQRLFLRRRKREKQLQEMRMQQMAHAAKLGTQLQMQNMLSELQQVHGLDLDVLTSRPDSLPACLLRDAGPAGGLLRPQPRPRPLRGAQSVPPRTPSDRYDRFFLPSYTGDDAGTRRSPQGTGRASGGKRSESPTNGRRSAGGHGGGKIKTAGSGAAVGEGSSSQPTLTHPHGSGSTTGQLTVKGGPGRQDRRRERGLSPQRKDTASDAQQRPRPHQAERFPLGIQTIV